MRRLLAAALLLMPQAAWAHGDHASGGGVFHALTSPEHIAVLLLASSALALLLKRHARRSGHGRNDTA